MALGWRGAYVRYKNYFLNIALFYQKRNDFKMFLELLLTLATIGVFAIGAIRPTLITISKLIIDIKEKEETLAKMEQKLNNLTKAQNILMQEQIRIALLDQAVPNDPEPAKFVRQIEGLAQRNNIEVLGLSSGEATLLGTEILNPQTTQSKQEEIQELPLGAGGFKLAINASQNYTPLISFLTDIENLRRPLVIDTFSLSSLFEEEKIVLLLEGRVPYNKKE